MKIALAVGNDLNIIKFFNENLSKDNAAVTSEEFFCPFGIRAAIKRNEIIVCTEKYKVVAALRFYSRKRQESVASLYQFAIAEGYKGKNLLKEMLKKTENKIFKVPCPVNSDFNSYYGKTGWILDGQDAKYNYWKLEI